MRVALAAGVLLAACGGDEASPEVVAAHARCVERTNELRVGAGRAPVAQSAALEAYADEGAEYDFYNGEPAHAHFQLEPVGGGIAFAENECPHWDLGFGGGDLNALVDACLQAFYDEGPGGGHYENMLGNYGSLGCGIYASGTDHTIIQDFGQ